MGPMTANRRHVDAATAMHQIHDRSMKRRSGRFPNAQRRQVAKRDGWRRRRMAVGRWLLFFDQRDRQASEHRLVIRSGALVDAPGRGTARFDIIREYSDILRAGEVSDAAWLGPSFAGRVRRARSTSAPYSGRHVVSDHINRGRQKGLGPSMESHSNRLTRGGESSCRLLSSTVKPLLIAPRARHGCGGRCSVRGKWPKSIGDELHDAGSDGTTHLNSARVTQTVEVHEWTLSGG